jgi:hypothetical protein
MSFRTRTIKVRDSVFYIQKEDADRVSVSRFESGNIVDTWEHISKDLAENIITNYHNQEENSHDCRNY